MSAGLPQSTIDDANAIIRAPFDPQYAAAIAFRTRARFGLATDYTPAMTAYLATVRVPSFTVDWDDAVQHQYMGPHDGECVTPFVVSDGHEAVPSIGKIVGVHLARDFAGWVCRALGERPIARVVVGSWPEVRAIGPTELVWYARMRFE